MEHPTPYRRLFADSGDDEIGDLSADRLVRIAKKRDLVIHGQTVKPKQVTTRLGAPEHDRMLVCPTCLYLVSAYYIRFNTATRVRIDLPPWRSVESCCSKMGFTITVIGPVLRVQRHGRSRSARMK